MIDVYTVDSQFHLQTARHDILDVRSSLLQKDSRDLTRMFSETKPKISENKTPYLLNFEYRKTSFLPSQRI